MSSALAQPDRVDGDPVQHDSENTPVFRHTFACGHAAYYSHAQAGGLQWCQACREYRPVMIERVTPRPAPPAVTHTGRNETV